jgi:DNA topoisomerase-1
MKVGPGADIAINNIAPLKHSTKPPARFTEATLVKRLEEEGIGRPSTYAPTISTIQARGYVERRGKYLAPTFLGIAVTQLLRDHFAEYVDIGFTVRMEEALDKIADGDRDWIDFLKAFYLGTADGEFGVGLDERIKQEQENIPFPTIAIGRDSDGVEYVVRIGRNQPFVQRGDGGAENTATIPDTVTYDEFTVDFAKELLANKSKGNEPIGTDPETGQNIYALVGPYGPYVQLGEASSDKKAPKPKRSGLPKGTAPENVTLEMALGYLALPRVLGEHPTTAKKVRAGTGPFGPYVVHDGDYRSLKGEDDVLTVSLDRALQLLAEPKRPSRTAAARTALRVLREASEAGPQIAIYDGRYGAYVSDGAANATLPKDRDVASITLEEALPLLAEAAERKPAKKKAAAKKSPATPKAKAAAKPKAAAKKPAAKKPAAKKPAAKKAP